MEEPLRKRRLFCLQGKLIMIKLNNPGATLFFPDDFTPEEAFAHTTHLGIGAHQDDIEIMAYHGILQCLHKKELWFGGIACTDGRGTPGNGPYAHCTEEEMRAIRAREQNTAAAIGQYSFVAQLDYNSESIRNPVSEDLKNDLKQLLKTTSPSIIYTHNPADKHDTHVAVCVAVIEALRESPVGDVPPTVYGCEVWRSLDWLLDADKVIMSVAGHENIANALLGAHDSQISSGKKYNRATVGRWLSNATFFDPRSQDIASKVSFAMDLSPLVQNPDLDISDYVQRYIERVAADITARLDRQLKRS